VQNFFPKTVYRHTHAIVLTNDRCEIADEVELLIGSLSSAKEADDAPLRLIAIHPFKTGRIGITLMQRRIAAVQSIEIAQPMPQSSMKRSFQQVPLQAGIVIPLGPLAELIPHEQELPAGVAEHEPIQQPQIRKLLPLIARHLAQHGTLTVDDLHVRERQ